MTNKEAIEELKAKVNLAKELEDEEVNFISIEALDLAIKALELSDAIDQAQKMERNEKCDSKYRCYDYKMWHCTGCNGNLRESEYDNT